MPFDSQNVPIYLDGITHQVIKDKSNEEIKAVNLIFRIEPMTRELAAELDDAIRGTLFRRNDAEINPHIKQVLFTFKPKPQEIQFRPDPTVGKVSLTIDEAKLHKFRARLPKDSRAWVLFFTATTANLSGNDLLYLQEALYKQHFLTFANATAGLFDEDEKAEKRARRAAQPTLETATAH